MAIKYPQPRCVCYRAHGNRWRWIGKKGAGLICYGRLTVCFPGKEDFYLSFLYFINRWVEIKCNNEMSCTNWHTKPLTVSCFGQPVVFASFRTLKFKYFTKDMLILIDLPSLFLLPFLFVLFFFMSWDFCFFLLFLYIFKFYFREILIRLFSFRVWWWYIIYGSIVFLYCCAILFYGEGRCISGFSSNSDKIWRAFWISASFCSSVVPSRGIFIVIRFIRWSS